MTDFDRIRNFIIEYETENKYTDKELIDLITHVCFARPSRNNDIDYKKLCEQFMWERNVALEQLEEFGCGFGEKPEFALARIKADKELETIEKILNHIRELQTQEMPIREMVGICKVGEYLEQLKEQENTNEDEKP